MTGHSEAVFARLPRSLTRADFVARFGGVYEHSPWVAETVYGAGVDETLDYVEVMHTRLSQAMLAADHDTQLKLVNAHPDLAGKAAIRWQRTLAGRYRRPLAHRKEAPKQTGPSHEREQRPCGRHRSRTPGPAIRSRTSRRLLLHRQRKPARP